VLVRPVARGDERWDLVVGLSRREMGAGAGLIRGETPSRGVEIEDHMGTRGYAFGSLA
jgi:hypothetical protein